MKNPLQQEITWNCNIKIHKQEKSFWCSQHDKIVELKERHTQLWKWFCFCQEKKAKCHHPTQQSGLKRQRIPNSTDPFAVPIAIFILISQVRGLKVPTSPCNHCSNVPLSTNSYTSILHHEHGLKSRISNSTPNMYLRK